MASQDMYTIRMQWLDTDGVQHDDMVTCRENRINGELNTILNREMAYDGWFNIDAKKVPGGMRGE